MYFAYRTNVHEMKVQTKFDKQVITAIEHRVFKLTSSPLLCCKVLENIELQKLEIIEQQQNIRNN